MVTPILVDSQFNGQNLLWIFTSIVINRRYKLYIFVDLTSISGKKLILDNHSQSYVN